MIKSDILSKDEDFKIRYKRDNLVFEFEPIFNYIHIYKNNEYLDYICYPYSKFEKDSFIHFCDFHFSNYS